MAHSVHPLAGTLAPETSLIDIGSVVSDYYSLQPNPAIPAERVAFGTSGHRGKANAASFNEDHILAIAQALVEHRAGRNVTGPIFVGRDTHALSEPAFRTTLEVFAAAGLEVCTTKAGTTERYTPTPAISHAILSYNRGRKSGFADGVVITPSHNPPTDGGFKYNPISGGPAAGDETKAIENRANALLESGLRDIARTPFRAALAQATDFDFITPYVSSLSEVLDMQAIAQAGVKIGVDPMGGSGIAYWAPIAEAYGLDITIVNDKIDGRFAFMRLDHDGKIRMDCSSPYAMAGLVALKDSFDIAFGNDTDYDRHGIVDASGLMNPNHYLAVAIQHLFKTRDWPGAAIGKTLVSSSMIDHVARDLGVPLREVPVGFKWFVDGLASGELGFGGEESAGASFLRKDGQPWSTDKDGILLDLLAAEILAKTGESPSTHYQRLTEKHGAPVYERIEAPATPEEKSALKRLSESDVTASTLAGDKITQVLTEASGHPIGGLKVATDFGWFAARPSGTEAVYKIYAESFKGRDHLSNIQEEAQALVAAALA